MVRDALHVALDTCRLRDARGVARRYIDDLRAKGRHLDELAEHKAHISVLSATCRPALRRFGFGGTGEAWHMALIRAVHEYATDEVVRRATMDIEAALGCTAGTLFGIECGPPRTSLSLWSAQRIMRQVQHRIGQRDFKEALAEAGSSFDRRLATLSEAVVSIAIANGYGFDNTVFMLGCCMRHSTDSVVARAYRELVANVGIPTPSWSREQVHAYAEEVRLLLSSTNEYQQLRLQLDATCIRRSAQWRREISNFVMSKEAALFAKYGLEASSRGLTERELNLFKYSAEPAVAEALDLCTAGADRDSSYTSSSRILRCSPETVSITERSGSCDAKSATAVAVLETAGSDAHGTAARSAFYEDLVAAKDRYIASLTAKVAQQGAEHAEIWAEVVSRDQKVSKLSAHIAEQSGLVLKLQSEAVARDREMASLSARIMQYSEHVAQVQEQAVATDRFAAELTATMAEQQQRSSGSRSTAPCTTSSAPGPSASLTLVAASTPEEPSTPVAWPSSPQVGTPVTADASRAAVCHGAQLLARLAHQAEAITTKEEEMSHLRTDLLGKESQIAQLVATIEVQERRTTQLEEQDDEIRALQARLVVELQTSTMWQAEALELDEHIVELQAEMVKLSTIVDCCCCSSSLRTSASAAEPPDRPSLPWNGSVNLPTL